MKGTEIQTERLKLVPMTLEETRAMVERMEPSVRAQLSPDWLARLERATEPDVWWHGFSVVERGENLRVGSCGFKGPADSNGMVEIAYGVDPEHRGRGYATEAARALVKFALGFNEVRLVRAHTLPEANASTQVLTKCGFRNVGEVIDPEDGLVWRWETESNGFPMEKSTQIRRDLRSR